jgi:hypothetical protein
VLNWSKSLSGCTGQNLRILSLAASLSKALSADARRFTQIHADDIGLNDLSGYVIGCAPTVLYTLGTGFLEKVYESVLAIEMRAAGLAVAQQFSARVHCNDAVVSE